jgi:hypothetical protein
MSFFSTPTSPGDEPQAVSGTSSNLVPGDYELTATASYNISLDPMAPANSEWVFTCANKSVDNFPITILGGAAITWTLPTGASSPASENFVINRGQCVITIRKTAVAENYSVTVSGVTRTQSISTTVSPLVGVFLHAKPTASKTAAFGWLAVTPGTITNGATLYPAWAAMYPEFVSGSNIVFPADVNGMFLRNVGGNAAATGVFQADRTARNGLGVSDPGHNHSLTLVGSALNVSGGATNSAVFGGGSTGSATTGITLNTGDVETNPDNRAYQLYTLVDTFARSFSAINPVNLVQTLSNSSTEIPSNAAVQTRFNRSIWYRSHSGTVATPNHGGTQLTGATTRTLLNNVNATMANYVSSSTDWGLQTNNGTAPQLAITIAGTYEITFSAGFQTAGTSNTRYVLEIGKYSSANVLLEILGQSGGISIDATNYSFVSVVGIGNFAVGEKIGWLLTSQGGGNFSHINTTAKAISF